MVLFATLGVAGSLLVAAPALAQTTTSGSAARSPSQAAGAFLGRGHMMGQMPGVFAYRFRAISGTTLTVQSKGFGKTGADADDLHGRCVKRDRYEKAAQHPRFPTSRSATR